MSVNGCAMKEQFQLDAIREIPTDKLILETDCPYCGISLNHAGYKFVKTQFKSKQPEKYESGCMVKGRNEPCTLV